VVGDEADEEVGPEEEVEMLDEAIRLPSAPSVRYSACGVPEDTVPERLVLSIWSPFIAFELRAEDQMAGALSWLDLKIGRGRQREVTSFLPELHGSRKAEVRALPCVPL